jgi:DNA-binding protein H-NS
LEIDLNSLALKELKDLQARVARAIATFEDRRRKEVLARLDEQAREMGYTLAELLGGMPARKAPTGAAKYANPANPAQTWTGRGRRPAWYDEAMKAGKTPEDLAI